MNYIHDIIYYFFRGRKSIVSLVFLAIFGIIYMFLPYKTVKCVNGLCRVTTGKKVVSTFSADNIESCTINSRRCGSSRRERWRDSCSNPALFFTACPRLHLVDAAWCGNCSVPVLDSCEIIQPMDRMRCLQAAGGVRLSLCERSRASDGCRKRTAAFGPRFRFRPK